MKKSHFFHPLLCGGIVLLMAACSNDASVIEPNTRSFSAFEAEVATADTFAQKKDEVNLPTTIIDDSNTSYYNDPACATAVAKLMEKANVDYAVGFNNVEITQAQFNEIATYVNKSIIGKNDTTEYKKMMAILKWCKNNITYDWVDNTAYAVFKSKKGVCQGYSNLMNVMLHTQNIPCVNANGFLANTGGHAWVYAYADSLWYVCDPTNNGTKAWKMTAEVNSYKNTLQPWSIDMKIYEDDNFSYEWRDKLFNVREVKQSQTIVSVPWGALGYTLTSFDPVDGINEEVRELYISYNIKSVGRYADGLTKNGTNLENIHIWNDKNHYINDFDGCIYDITYKSGKTTYNALKYVPGAKKSIKVAPMATAEKNIIAECETLEEIHFDATTLTYEDYAVENCPKVSKIYVPIGSTVPKNAFYGCASNLEVIYYDPTETGIHDIRL